MTNAEQHTPHFLSVRYEFGVMIEYECGVSLRATIHGKSTFFYAH